MERELMPLETKRNFRKLLPNMRRVLTKGSISIASMAMLMTTVGCDPNQGIMTGDNLTPAATANETLMPDYLFINRYYPELQKTGLKAKEKMSLAKNNAFGKPIDIFNYTQYALNPNSILDIYNFFTLLAHNNPETKIKYKLNDNERIFSLVPEDRVKSLITLLLPPEAPRPNGLENLGISWGGNDPFGKALSYVRIDDDNTDRLFTTDKERVTLSLAVEACQQAVRVLVSDNNGNNIKDSKETDIAQEILCNSLGRAVAARQLGIPYAEYASLTINYGPIFPDQLAHPFILLMKKVILN